MALGVMGLRHVAGGELVAASCCRVVASAPWVAATPPQKKIYILKPQKQTHPTKKPRGCQRAGGGLVPKAASAM